MDWKSIETVPKDGTVVLLYHSSGSLCGYAPRVRPKKAVAIGFFDQFWVTGVPGGHAAGGDEGQFTHWMELPPSPLARS